MKKLNQLSSYLYYFLILILILILVLLFYLFDKKINSTVSINKSISEITVFDKEADWTTVKNNDLTIQHIDRELKGHFIDPDTNGCFFLVMKTFGIDVDIDEYYWDFFEEVDQEGTAHQGKISPDMLYQNSLIYLDENDIDLSVKNISNKNIDYLLTVGSNNYPIIIWFGSDDWLNATPYVIYKVENNMVYMYNLTSTIGLNIDTFKERYAGYALVYGKYW